MLILLLSLSITICNPMFDIKADQKLNLSEKKLNKLFELCDTKEDKELTEYLNWPNEVVFVVNGDKILSASKSRKDSRLYEGTLYGSRKLFVEEVDAFKKEVELVNTFRPFQCQIFNEEFIKNIPANIVKLQEAIGLATSDCDFSLASLKKVDSLLNKHEEAFLAEQYINAVSYMGEVIRKEIGGAEWVIEQVGSSNECTAVLIQGDKVLTPCFPYYESILEKRPSLWETAYVEIYRHGFKVDK